MTWSSSYPEDGRCRNWARARVLVMMRSSPWTQAGFGSSRNPPPAPSRCLVRDRRATEGRGAFDWVSTGSAWGGGSCALRVAKMADLPKVQSDRPSIRGGWPWIGLLILSALYWLLMMLGLRLSPVHVPVAIQSTVAFCMPFVGLIGLGKGRLPTPLITMLAFAAVGSLAVVALSTVLGGSGHTDFPATATVEGRAIRLVHEVQPAFSSSCYDLNVELAAGWLWQRLDLTTCLDHGNPGTAGYDPAGLTVERGPVPFTLAITADVPTDDVSKSVRKRLGLYRVDSVGRLISVAASSHGP